MANATSTVTASATQRSPSQADQRLLSIDNLRWVIIILVVVAHVAVTYSPLGGCYYKEHETLDTPSFLAFAFLEMHLQAFFMGLLFLIAGYFVPGAFGRKGPRRFVADRAVRLGLPTLVYALVLEPFIAVGLLDYLKQHGTTFPVAYAQYITTLQFVGGTGPLWFALALLVFCVAYALVRSALGWRWQVVKTEDAQVPAYRALLALGGLMALCSFLVRLVLPIGTDVLNMQLCFFPQYILLFGVGVLAYRGDWLRRVPRDLGLSCLRLAFTAGPFIWFLIMISGGAASRDFSAFFGGFRWQSAAYAAWESFFCVTVCVGLLVWFRENFNQQGRLAKFLADNSFAVYVLHAPLIVALTKAFHGLGVHPFVKFLLLCIISLPTCFLFAHLVARRIPGLNRLLYY
jgi:peptidoglycan/LPS O-acetylase OafA/YrhL